MVGMKFIMYGTAQTVTGKDGDLYKVEDEMGWNACHMSAESILHFTRQMPPIPQRGNWTDGNWAGE